SDREAEDVYRDNFRRLKSVACEVAVEHGDVDIEGGVALLLNRRRVSHDHTSFKAKYE
ncbi:hypothetical protein R1flu_006437, partial [Riccia fluitans]